MPMTRKQALATLNIKEDRRIILCLDGGGIRGIMTIQLLKLLERTVGMPCHQFCDMVSGTSTGGIIAGLIASGRTATQIEKLYIDLVEQVFTSRSLTAHQLANPPMYTKEAYVGKLKELVGDTTFKETCTKTDIDLMITSKDVAAGEETFFSYFVSEPQTPYTYENVLLRAAMEATMSAPTYFYPMERFVDGGVTAYNNPALAAIIEAIEYGPKNKYRRNKITVLSFGTGCRPQFIDLKNIINPKGVDAIFWLNWLLTESGDDASDQQTYLLRSKKLFPGVDFRRYQISLDRRSIKQLPNRKLSQLKETKAEWLHELSDEELGSIKLDNVDYFPVMKEIGTAMCAYIQQEANVRESPPFSFDLVNKRGRDLLVSREGDTARIVKQMSSPQWIDDRRREV